MSIGVSVVGSVVVVIAVAVGSGIFGLHPSMMIPEAENILLRGSASVFLPETIFRYSGMRADLPSSNATSLLYSGQMDRQSAPHRRPLVPPPS